MDRCLGASAHPPADTLHRNSTRFRCGTTSGALQRFDRRQGGADLVPFDVQIPLRLQVQPEAFRRPEESSQTQCRVRGNPPRWHTNGHRKEVLRAPNAPRNSSRSTSPGWMGSIRSTWHLQVVVDDEHHATPYARQRGEPLNQEQLLLIGRRESPEPRIRVPGGRRVGRHLPLPHRPPRLRLGQR